MTAAMSAHLGRAPLGAAAADLVGCPFRLHGRDPATGLDCVGLIAASLEALGHQPAAPQGYGLRNLAIDHWLGFAEQSGLVPAPGAVASDEVLLVELGYGQHHLMVTTAPDDAVHAHAGLRRVVRHRRDPATRIRAKWYVPLSSRD